MLYTDLWLKLLDVHLFGQTAVASRSFRPIDHLLKGQPQKYLKTFSIVLDEKSV